MQLNNNLQVNSLLFISFHIFFRQFINIMYSLPCCKCIANSSRKSSDATRQTANSYFPVLRYIVIKQIEHFTQNSFMDFCKFYKFFKVFNHKLHIKNGFYDSFLIRALLYLLARMCWKCKKTSFKNSLNGLNEFIDLL